MSFNGQKMTLKEAGVTLIDCDHKTPKAQDVGRPYVGIPQLKDCRITLDGARLISEEDFIHWRRKAKPQEHDVILSRRCNPGETGYVTGDLDIALGQNLVLLRADGTTIYPPFLRWVTRGKYWWNQVNAFINVGAVFESLKCADIPKFEILVPSLEEQKLLTNCMSAIDDKVALNSQFNQTLEAMAQAIFKSWFVDFDPVKAKMNGEQPEGMDATTASLFPEKLVESELGLIPEGWSVGKLSELIKFANGKSGKKSDSGRYPLYGANGIIGFSQEAKFDDAVIIGRVGAYCGAIEYCNSKFWASDNTIVATAKSDKAQLPFVLYLLKFLDLNKYAGGAAQPLLNQMVLNSLEFPIPSDLLLERFGTLISTMLDKITSCNEENKSLENLRDTLLPKLLSGEINLDTTNTESIKEAV